MGVKKLGVAAKFGSRYGTRTKKIFIAIKEAQKLKRECPFCERNTLKRKAAGIWFCKKCKTKFAGGAYFPTTPGGEEMTKICKSNEDEVF
jgi:large subunit ribosomal protein L37Ae